MIDGQTLTNLDTYFAVSPSFPIDDTDLLDDLEIPIDDDNFAVAAGYWLMLPPLTPGQHTIQFYSSGTNPVFGELDLGVTYNITVERVKASRMRLISVLVRPLYQVQ